jgi:lipopolysaccharide export system protein LptC
VSALRWAWDRLTLYLPVLLMGVLAMATYWLVRSTPIDSALEPVAPLLHQSDYFMRQFSINTFDAEGKLKSQVSGAEARHFPDTDTLEIDQVTIRSFDPQGHLTTATARQAITNGDASEVQLMGGAQVVRAASASTVGKEQPALTFSGEYLHAFMKTQRVISDKPVLLMRGQDRFAADSMDFDNQQRVIRLEGRVKGTLVPTLTR